MASFRIVPVLDLKGGQVVHAKAGERARYLPIQSKLAATSEPHAVLDGLLSLMPFSCVYIADLDAIEGRGTHRDLISALASRHPGVEFWIDSGFTSPDAAAAAAGPGVVPVLGSESWHDLDGLAAAITRLDGACVLSLDHRGDSFVGPRGLDARPEIWPERVIVMTLSRVGSGAGPDVARLTEVQRLASARRVFAAGGVRGREDLDGLAARSFAGVLVATALHDGRLGREALAGFT